MIVYDRYEQGRQEVGYFQFRQLEHVESDAQNHDAADGVEFAYDVRRHEGHDESRQQVEKSLINKEDDTDGNDA